MMDLGQLLDLFEGPAMALAAVFLRITGLMLMLPALGERMIPARIRLGTAFALTVVLAPMLPQDQIPATLTAALIVSEIAVGLVFGAVLRFLAQALLVAGTIAAQATSLSQLLGAPSAEPSSAIGSILHIAGLALLMASGLHLALLDMLVDSWRVFPVGFVLPGADLASWGTARVADAFAIAVTLSMPFIIVSVLYNVTLGIINKAMPQLMVALVGAPAITGMALVTLAVSAVFILTVWRDHVGAVMRDPFLP